MPQRTTRKYTRQQAGILGRAKRATEDPVEMAAPATMGRGARYMYRVLQKNPSLTEDQAVKAAMLLLRADMVRARAGQPYATDAG